MERYKREFVEFALKSKALRFGDFTLKSGRKSPFFFNAGDFFTGEQISQLGAHYARAIAKEFKGGFDVLFGPAYKGIPLSVITAAQLYEKEGIVASYSSNRKEAKDHGEKGAILGSPLGGGARVLLIDDVVTSGASVYEAISLLKEAAPGAKVVGLIVALDRQEKISESGESALSALEKDCQMKVRSIVSMSEVVAHVKEFHSSSLAKEVLDSIEDYYERFGAKDIRLP